MAVSSARQIDLRCRGRIVNIMAAPRLEGWSWGLLIDGYCPMEGSDQAIPSPELALAEGIATAEELIDSGYDDEALPPPWE